MRPGRHTQRARRVDRRQSDDARDCSRCSAPSWVHGSDPPRPGTRGSAKPKTRRATSSHHGVRSRTPGLTWPEGGRVPVDVPDQGGAKGDIALSVVATKYHNWGERCTTSGCSAAVYDLTEMWYSPDLTASWTRPRRFAGRRVAKPFFTLGEKGDSRFSFHELQFSDDAYLTETTLFAPNTWGEDLDALGALRPSLEPFPTVMVEW